MVALLPRLVHLIQGAHLNFLHPLLFLGQAAVQLKDASLSVGAEGAGGLTAGGAGDLFLGELGEGLGEGADAGRAYAPFSAPGSVRPGIDSGRSDADAARDLGLVDVVLRLQTVEKLRQILGAFLVCHALRVPFDLLLLQAKVEAWRVLMQRATSPSRAVVLGICVPR